MEGTYTQGYTCDYCLGETTKEVGPETGYEYPDTCPHCKTAKCDECGTRLKPPVTMCHGCGTLNPDCQARFCRNDSTSVVYMEERVRRKWKRGDDLYRAWGGRDNVRIDIEHEDGTSDAVRVVSHERWNEAHKAAREKVEGTVYDRKEVT